MYHLTVYLWLSNGTYGKVSGGNFPTRDMCDQVGREFKKSVPHVVKFECYESA